MPFFVVFILGAVILGAGAMLSPAWRTVQPRIGLAATLCLALVVGGAVFWAELFGWDTLVIDYLLFFLVSVVVLGGTLSQAQMRAEAKGEELPDSIQGWPGPRDLAVFGLLGLALVMALAWFELPWGPSGPISALLTLTAREGRTFHDLSPFYPNIQVYTAPGFHALTAYLSQQLRQPIPMIQLSVGALAVLLSAWTAYDWGAEWRDKRLGRAFALLAAGFGLALFIMGELAALLGLAFAYACAVYALRALRHGWLGDVMGAGLLLGATVYADFTVALFTVLGYSAWAAYRLLIAPRALKDLGEGAHSLARRRWVALGVPLVALAGLAPYLAANLARLLDVVPRLVDPSALSAHYAARAALIGLAIPVTAWLGLIVLRAWEGLPQGLRAALRGPVFSLGAGLLALTLGSLTLWGFGDPLGSNARDVLAWAARHLPKESRLLVTAHAPDAAWAMGLSERAALPLPQATFLGTSAAPPAVVGQDALPLLISDPNPQAWGEDQADALRLLGITHVYLPFNDSDSSGMDVRYFELAHSNGWASLWRVRSKAP
ncbi:MAG: hypothetical protein NZ750_08050 [Anaerolineae bacterium]|nr:hypothetical protein [Anaerolineae bacterium]MDW8172301.1 hypothetical protein [Anaerolineae bacterium]